MIESILLEEQDHQQNVRKGAKKSHWVMFILFSVLLAGAAVAVVLAFDARASNTGSSPVSPPILTSPSATQMCDACTLVPNMEDHVICTSCGFNREDSKALLCPSGYGDLTLSKVTVGGHSNSLGLAAIQNECSSQYADYFEDSGPFACTFTLDTLEADLGHSGQIKASYVCQKNVEVETYSETPAFRLRSPSRSLPEPFLSSAQVKCDKTKFIADTVEKAKLCAIPGDAPFTLSCTGGTDARIIVQKMAEPVKTPSNARANKKRAQMVTNFCAAGNMDSAGTCTISPDSLLLDTETDLAGKTFEISYICSYASSTLVLQKALDVSESGSDAPGEPLLTSALVKCGGRKEYASTVEVAKTCSDQDFTLSCNPDADPRIIILSMWDGDTKGSKKAKKRAKAATTLCKDLVDGVCTFSLSDLGETTTEAPVEPDVLADTSISVKYLCSYSSPVLSF